MRGFRKDASVCWLAYLSFIVFRLLIKRRVAAYVQSRMSLPD